MIKPRYSQNYEAVKKRIQRLPKEVNDVINARIKRDAVETIEAFQDGIRNDSLGLQRLKPKTVEAKARMGYSQPETPLYGKGDDDPNSYINSLAIRKIKSGWRVYRRWVKHHKSWYSLRVLMDIHENGATIIGVGGAVIRIPPRPAEALALRKVLARKEAAEDSDKVRRAILALTRRGDASQLRKVAKEFSKGTDKHEE